MCTRIATQSQTPLDAEYARSGCHHSVLCELGLLTNLKSTAAKLPTPSKRRTYSFVLIGPSTVHSQSVQLNGMARILLLPFGDPPDERRAWQYSVRN
jgi:hypothetical protein